MSTVNELKYARLSTLDAALSGVFIGGLAGLPMAIYMAGVILMGGYFFYPGMAISTFFLAHLAISGVYGLLYSIGSNYLFVVLKGTPTAGLAIILGAFYASLLLAIAILFILPAGRTAQFEVPLVHIGIAHFIYGLFLSLLVHYTRFKQ
jgi:hypothetical protein